MASVLWKELVSSFAKRNTPHLKDKSLYNRNSPKLVGFVFGDVGNRMYFHCWISASVTTHDDIEFDVSTKAMRGLIRVSVRDSDATLRTCSWYPGASVPISSFE